MKSIVTRLEEALTFMEICGNIPCVLALEPKSFAELQQHYRDLGVDVDNVPLMYSGIPVVETWVSTQSTWVPIGQQYVN